MKKIRTRTATLYVDDNNVLHIDMHEGIEVDYEDALDNSLVIKNITGNKPVLKLIDARSHFTIDSKARKFVDENDLKQTIARAVVKHPGWSKLLTIFFNTLSKPGIPTKIFSDYESAYNWLMTHRQTE